MSIPYTLIVNPERCTGCRLCESVCSLHHEGECNPVRSRIRVIRSEEEGLDIPVTCLHCEKAPCIEVCPSAALKRDPTTAAVLLDEGLCIGCKICITMCPFGAPSVDYVTKKVIKCDLCDGDPLCVRFCETKAIEYLRVDKIGVVKKRRLGIKILHKTLASTTGIPPSTDLPPTPWTKEE